MHRPTESYFVPTVVPGTDIPILVTEIGEGFCVAGQGVERGISEILALEFVTHGVLYLRQGKEERLIGQNEVMVLKRGVKHSYAVRSATLHKLYFGLSGEFAEILMERLDNRIRPLHAKAVRDRFNEIITIALSKPDNFQQRLSEIAYVVLLELLVSQEHSKGRGMTLEGTLLHALQFMQENMGREITVEEIARHCCISMPHLHGLFRSRLHISPIRHFHAQKVKVAQNFLRTTDLSCKEISSRLGFEDQLHFSRLFKKACGTSPAEYRAAIGNAAM